MRAVAPAPERLTASKQVLICIPAYNEAENIAAVLDQLLAHPTRDLFDVLVVDDGSADATRAVCERRDVLVITHVFNMGYGAALKTAYKYAEEHRYDYIIQMDADGQHDVGNIERLYHELVPDGEAATPDIVIGSRFLQDSVTFHIPFYKKFVISIFRLIIKIATKKEITDPTSGLQGLNHRAFSFYAKYNQFAVDYPDANMIIQMALNQFSITEAPAIMHERVQGVSMHTGIYKPIKYIIKMILSVLIVCIRETGKARKRKRSE